MRTTALRVAVALALLVPATGAVTATAPPAEALAPGWFQAVNAHSGKCLEDLGFGAQYGAPVGQWDCVGGSNQQWRLDPVPGMPAGSTYSLVNGHTGTCLSKEHTAPTADFTPVTLTPCRDLAGQRWTVRRSVNDDTLELYLTSDSGGTSRDMCLDMRYWAVENGAPAIVMGCLHTPNERWRLVPTASAWSTPRVQMFGQPDFRWDKLDADAPKYVADLSGVKRGCVLLLPCTDTWANAITSIDTTGGGQVGAYLTVWRGRDRTGGCLEIPVGRRLPNLAAVKVAMPGPQLPTRYVPPVEATTSWANDIESFEVSRFHDVARVCQLAIR